MAQLGTVQTVIVCAPGTSGIQGPCADGQVETTTQAYLIDPSEASTFDALAGPFDYTYAASLWSFSFSVVVGLWWVSRNIGVVLNFIRRG